MLPKNLLEGFCVYDLSQILPHIIETEKIISIKLWDDRKLLFQYGKTEKCNISPPIKMTHLKQQKFNMSSREMWTFCHFLPLNVGYLITEFDETILNKLQSNIKKHHHLHEQLFGNTLKSKHHFVTHYPSSIRQVGPLKHLWCFKFESKHRELKLYTYPITSRRNTPLPIGIKCMLKFYSRLLFKKVLQDSYIFGDIENIN